MAGFEDFLRALLNDTTFTKRTLFTDETAAVLLNVTEARTTLSNLPPETTNVG